MILKNVNPTNLVPLRVLAPLGLCPEDLISEMYSDEGGGYSTTQLPGLVHNEPNLEQFIFL